MTKIIHFICTGNTYRSRLAEAYFNSLKLPDIKAISSGINAGMTEDGPIEWYAMRLIHDNWLIEYMSRDSKRTSRELLNKGIFTVFMKPIHLDVCKNSLGYSSELNQVWNIEDLHPRGLDDNDIIETSEKTFEPIKAKVNSLAKMLVKQ